jgi:hypothetical protein
MIQNSTKQILDDMIVKIYIYIYMYSIILIKEMLWTSGWTMLNHRRSRSHQFPGSTPSPPDVMCFDWATSHFTK